MGKGAKTLLTSYSGSIILKNAWGTQFSCSVMPNSLWPHEPQHTRPPRPSPPPGVHPNLCPLVPSNHLILSCPLLLLPLIFPSIRVFSSDSVLWIRWPKYWSFSFSISPFSEHSGLISFRMDWLDPLAVQGTLKSLFQHHSSKASVLQCSAWGTGLALIGWIERKDPRCEKHTHQPQTKGRTRRHEAQWKRDFNQGL